MVRLYFCYGLVGSSNIFAGPVPDAANSSLFQHLPLLRCWSIVQFAYTVDGMKRKGKCSDQSTLRARWNVSSVWFTICLLIFITLRFRFGISKIRSYATRSWSRCNETTKRLGVLRERNQRLGSTAAPWPLWGTASQCTGRGITMLSTWFVSE